MPIQRCPPPPAKKSKAPVIEVTHHYSEKAMATHSSTLAWKIPWAEEPGRLQSIGSWSQTWLSDFTFTFHFHALEKEMAAHSTVLAWRIPGMGEPSGPPTMGSHRVRYDWSDLALAYIYIYIYIYIYTYIYMSKFNVSCHIAFILKIAQKLRKHFSSIWNYYPKI